MNCGTNSNYSHGCRCADCKEAHRLYSLENRKQRAYGNLGRVPAAPFTQLLRSVSQPKATLREISNATGIAPHTLERIRAGEVTYVYPKTVRAIRTWVETLPSETERLIREAEARKRECTQTNDNNRDRELKRLSRARTKA